MNVKPILICFFLMVAIFAASPVYAEKTLVQQPQESIDDVITRVEKRYQGNGFSSRFVQMSTIKAMNISDTAVGKVFVRTPDKMRWEYETPDPQLIISNGESLWVYRPVDNQVMIGKPPVFFKGGKGASFLSDIKSLRTQFDISFDTPEDSSLYLLKLIPHDKALDLSVVYIFVTKSDATFKRIITLNSYGDETRVDMFDYEFNLNLDDAQFTFVIPQGADVVQIDE